MTDFDPRRIWTLTLINQAGARATRRGLPDAAMAAALRSLLLGGELTPPRARHDRDHVARRRIANRPAPRAT